MENRLRINSKTDDYEITLNGTAKDAAFAIGCIMVASEKGGCPSFTASTKPTTGRIELKMSGNRNQARITLRELYEDEVVDCDHELTEEIPVDDNRWIGADGELHERSNPDATRCQICGKYYNPSTEEWEVE